jgi:hypothetical protein
MEADCSSPRIPFNKKEHEDFKGTSFQAEMSLRPIDSLPRKMCARERSDYDSLGENCTNYYAISESERR